MNTPLILFGIVIFYFILTFICLNNDYEKGVNYYKMEKCLFETKQYKNINFRKKIIQKQNIYNDLSRCELITILNCYRFELLNIKSDIECN